MVYRTFCILAVAGFGAFKNRFASYHQKSNHLEGAEQIFRQPAYLLVCQSLRLYARYGPGAKMTDFNFQANAENATPMDPSYAVISVQ